MSSKRKLNKLGEEQDWQTLQGTVYFIEVQWIQGNGEWSSSLGLQVSIRSHIVN